MPPRSPRRSIPSPAQDAFGAPSPAAVALDPPNPLTDTRVEQLRDLLTSDAWQWLLGRVQMEFGSKATVARLALLQKQNPDPATYGLQTHAVLAAAQAVERVMNFPRDHVEAARLERHRRTTMSAQERQE